MRQWRVGTFSMGLLLLFAGVGLLFARFQAIPVVAYVWQWWPAIFIVLGCEVLLQSYFQRDENSKLKYDVFSIFIILVIVMAGMGLQAAQEAGIMDFIQEKVMAEEYYLQTDRQINLEKEIQKVVIEAERCPRLNIATGAGDSILCSAQAGIWAQSKAEAEQVLQERVRVNSRPSGNTLFLSLSFSGADNHEGQFSLVLPGDLAVEIKHGYASLQMVNAQIGNDWLIKGDGPIDIALAPPSDLLVSALAADPLVLKGNLNWTTLAGQPLKMPAQNQDGQYPEAEITTDSGAELAAAEDNQAQAQVGRGTHKMTIIHQDGEITVNRLP